MLTSILMFCFILLMIKTDSTLINPQKKMLLALNEELYVKHNIIIIKDLDFGTNFSIIPLVKHLSQNNIFTSCLRTEQIISFMYEHFIVPTIFNNETNTYVYDKSRIITIQHLKTVALLSEKYLSSGMSEIFNALHEFAVSKFIWLIFGNSNQLIKQSQYQYFYIPYNCQFLIAKYQAEYNYDINEIYHPKLNSSAMQVSYFAKWTEVIGLEVPEHDFYQRRLDMNGSILFLVADEPVDGYHPVERHDGEIFETISQIMNIKFIYEYISLEVPRGLKYEAAGRNPFNEIYVNTTFLTSGSTHYYILWPYYWKSPFFFFIRSEKNFQSHDAFSYLRAFGRKLWLAIIAWILVSGLCLLVIESGIKEQPFSKLKIFMALIRSFAIFANQDADKQIQTSSFRTAVITMRWVSLFIIQSYLTQILSFILSSKIQLPFSNMQELVEDGSYTVLPAMPNAFWNQYLADPWISIAYKRFFVEDEESLQGLQPMKNVCGDNKTALLAPLEWGPDVFVISECDVLIIPGPVIQVWKLMLLRFGSPYGTIFNRIIKSMFSAGLLRRFAREIEYSIFSSPIYGGTVTWGISKLHSKGIFDSLEIKNISSIFILLIILYLLSVGLLVSEYLYEVTRKNGKTKK